MADVKSSRYFEFVVLTLKCQRCLALVLILIVSFCEAYGQRANLKFEHIGREQGLSQLYVTAILQDSKGFIWFGTLDGVNKYDGYKFTSYRSNAADKNSISSNHINEIIEDSKGNIWIATSKGLNKFNREKENFTRYLPNKTDPHAISSGSVISIVEDAQGNLWVGCSGDGKAKGGLNLYEPKKNQFTFYGSKSSDALESFVTTDLLIDSYQNLWISHQNGLDVFDLRNKIFTDHYEHVTTDKGSLAATNVKSIYLDSNDNLWVATRTAGLDKFDYSTKTFLHYRHKAGDANSLPSDAVLSVAEDNLKNLWIGTENSGLSILNPNTMKFDNHLNDPNDDASLHNNFIQKICRDAKGGMWLGTAGGVDFFNPDNNIFTHYRRSTGGLNCSLIFCIREDSKGNLLIATDGGGLNIYDKSADEFTYLKHQPGNKNSICGDNVITVLEDSYQNLWIGTWNDGITVYNKEKNTYKHYKHDPYDPRSLGGIHPWVMYEDSKKNVWIGTFGGGLSLYDRDTDSFIRFQWDSKNPNAISSNAISSIFEDSKGSLWIGTLTGGLCVIDRNTHTFKTFLHDSTRNSISDNEVNNIYEDSIGNFWIGTNAGLNHFDRRSGIFTHFTEKDGFENNGIKAILPDTKGNLWVSTNSGISRFNVKTKEIKNFRISINWESLTHSALKTSNGEIYFGGLDGLIKFFPDSVKDIAYDPPIVFTSFEIFNNIVPIASDAHPDSPLKKSITETKEITISYKESVISFEFASLNYTDEQKKQYSYTLEGFDKDWNNIGVQRTATYTNLDPGEYILKVRGMNNEGQWSAHTAELKLIITPPFWRTWWFRTLAAALSAGIAFGWYRYRFNSINRQKRELEKQVKKHTSELEELYTEVKDSIKAAQVIQQSILPASSVIRNHLPEYFILNRAKDVVSGDFYWFGEVEGQVIVAVADCTGHGVSGAFMTINGYHLLNKVIYSNREMVAAKILDSLNQNIIEGLHSEDHLNGMDIGLCVINKKAMTLQYAGAIVPLYIVRGKELIQVKGDPFNVGLVIAGRIGKFTNHTIQIFKGDMIYMFSDGYADQIGGIEDEKFSYRRFRELLMDISVQDADNQLKHLERSITEWKGNHKQLDDILVLGFRIT